MKVDDHEHSNVMHVKFYRRFLASQNHDKISLDLSGCLVKVSGPPLLQNIFTTKNTIVSTNLLVWKFCGKAQFPPSFGRIA